MSEHTPGPWEIFQEINVLCSDGMTPLGASGNSRDIDYRGRAVANARLIAYAPDLLAACKESFKFLNFFCGDGDEYPSAFTVRDQLRTAIARAEGNKPKS